MAKFRYRMQSILEIKKKLEEQAKNEFAAARAALNEEEDKLEQLKKRKEAYEDEGRALRENTLNIMDIIENKEALLRMDEFIADQQLNEVALALTAVAQDQDVGGGLVALAPVEVHHDVAAKLVLADIEAVGIGLAGIIEGK